MKIKTFKVLLRQPPLNRLSWDYNGQVNACNQESALQWVQQHIAIQESLEKCKVIIQEVPSNAISIKTSAKTYRKVLENKIQAVINQKTSVFTSETEMPYTLSSMDGKYAMDVLVKEDRDLGVPTLITGKHSDIYRWILNQCKYQLSANNISTMEKLDNDARKEIEHVLETFENIGGVFSDPLPLGGKITDVLFQCGDLTKLSDDYAELKRALYHYRCIAGEAYALHQQIADALIHLQELKRDSHNHTVNQNMLMNTNHRPFLTNKHSLIEQLETANQSIEMTMQIKSSNTNMYDVLIDGNDVETYPSVSKIIEIEDTFHNVFLLNEYMHEDSTILVSVHYNNITSVPITLKGLTNNQSDGYHQKLVHNLLAGNNDNKDGYCVSSEVLSICDDYKMVQSLVVSTLPTIEIEITNPKAKEIENDFKVGNYVVVTLLEAFKFGQKAYSLEILAVDKGINSQRICIGPAKALKDIPMEEKSAYIISGVLKERELRDGNNDTFSFSFPITPKYENSEIALANTTTTVSCNILPGSHYIETPLVTVGHFKGNNQLLLARVSLHYYYDHKKKTVLLKENDYASKEATCLSLFNESLECVAKIYCYYGKHCYSVMNHSYWQFDQTLSDKLLPMLQKMVKNINDAWIKCIKENYAVSLQMNIPLSYKNAYLVFRDNQLLGFYDESKRQEYIDTNCTFLPFTSTYVQNTTIRTTDSFVNVLKSSGDTPSKYSGYSWYGLWKYKCNNDQEHRCVINGCTRTQTDSAHMVGAHLLLGVAASREANNGETVYILPLCKAHNSSHLTTPMSVGSDTDSLEITYTRPY